MKLSTTASTGMSGRKCIASSCFGELELKASKDESMYQILTSQKSEANNLFCKYIENNYVNWLKNPEEKGFPIMSNKLMKLKVLPVVDASPDPVFFILMNNLRYDQWRVIQLVIT